MFDLKPLADRVLIKRLEADERTASGLYIPDAAKEKPQKGKVIEVGPGKMTNDGKCIPVALKAGDIVFIGKYAGTEVDGDHIVVREDEILGIVKSA